MTLEVLSLMIGIMIGLGVYAIQARAWYLQGYTAGYARGQSAGEALGRASWKIIGFCKDRRSPYFGLPIGLVPPPEPPKNTYLRKGVG